MTRGWLLPALLLSIPIASAVWVWLERASTDVEDPVIEVHALENRTLTVATFAPRVGLPQDTTYSHTFQLRNDGSGEIVVADTTKSCTCLSAQLDRMVVPPGESAEVRMSVRPGSVLNKRGVFTILTKSGARFSYELRTTTYPPVTLDQRSGDMISFGTLTPGHATEAKHRLCVYSPPELEPPGLHWDSVRFRARPVTCTLADLGTKTVSDGRIRCRDYDVTLHVVPGSVPGLTTERLHFSCDDVRRPVYNFTFQVAWTVSSPVSIDPPRWMVRREQHDASTILHKVFRIEGPENLTVSVADVECSSEAITVEETSVLSPHSSEISVALDLTAIPQVAPYLGMVHLSLVGERTDIRETPLFLNDTINIIVTK